MSFAFAPTAATADARWAETADAAAALVAGERDGIANMANVAALIWQAIPDLNWAGFYRFDGSELVLGPFQGKAACIRIPLDKGVCGAAARTRATQRVDDVHAFPGHIACDADSRSELVVPVIAGDRLVGVLDLDSPLPGRFSAADQAGAEALVGRIAGALSDGPSSLI
ncbi:MAG: GAF domain-containing protein [Sphingopyxis sp.]|nr:GAF domain-containing protein [Sphingopyxis sp.]